MKGELAAPALFSYINHIYSNYSIKHTMGLTLLGTYLLNKVLQHSFLFYSLLKTLKLPKNAIKSWQHQR